MAIPQVFNSNTSFIIKTEGSELSLMGQEDNSQGCEDDKESLVQAIAPHLSRVMLHGTAKHVVKEGQELSVENPFVSIVAQAEREDFQEFSPTNTQCPYSRCQQLKRLRSVGTAHAFLGDMEDDVATNLQRQHHQQRKQRRKTRTGQVQEAGGEPPVICGLWVQEIDWMKLAGKEAVSSTEILPPPPEFTDSLSHSCSNEDQHSYMYDQGRSCADVCDCVPGLDGMSLSDDQYGSVEADNISSSEDGGGSECDYDLEQETNSVYSLEIDSDSSCCVEDDVQIPANFGVKDLTFDLMHVSCLNSCHAQWHSDTTPLVQSLLGNADHIHNPSTLNTSQRAFGLDHLSDISSILDELKGRVTQMPKQYGSLPFTDLIERTLKEWKHNAAVNEGLIFHHKLQPNNYQYREGEEYCILHHIQNGSFGDVFRVRDKRTGFLCAAKRIPLSYFSREEVSTWSALQSPRVVELFGAVRERLNVVLFMDLKPACLAQLLKGMNSLPEDLALHYLHQLLGALEHLHNTGVLHLDIKVDNVLLSADCRDTFLCDFGLSQLLDDTGRSSKAIRGATFPGTETHMAPEVARGDPLSAKADVWSSCCMLLHMLNGCHPWIRHYSYPLCLQIVNEPPPLWEVPSACNNFTAKVFRAGLQKDPERRASAKQLRRKTSKALRAVGGLSPRSVRTACDMLHCGKTTPPNDSSCSLSSGIPPHTPPASASGPIMHWVSPWRTIAVEEDGNDWGDGDSDSVSREWDSQPKSLRCDITPDEKDWDTGSDCDIDMYMGEEEFMQERWPENDRDYEGDWEEEGQDVVEEQGEEEDEWDSSVSTEYFHALRGLFPLLKKGQQRIESPWGSKAELEYLRDDVAIDNTLQTPSPEPRDDPPSCFSCSDTSQIDASDKDSDHSSDDLSSGVFSTCNSQTDGHLEWLASGIQPSTHCLKGVDIWIENIQGECLRIRERWQVKVGHVAVGISDQILGKAFTLETLDRKLVSYEEEIKESGVWLRCVPAPDTCQRWRWRVREGKLELQE